MGVPAGTRRNSSGEMGLERAADEDVKWSGWGSTNATPRNRKAQDLPCIGITYYSVHS